MARTNVGRPGLYKLGPSQTFLCGNGSDKEDGCQDSSSVDGSNEEDGTSPKYSLRRMVTAGESSMRNFLMPGV